MQKKNYYHIWKSQGRCTYCGGERDSESLRCSKCKENLRISVKKYRDKQIQKNNCVSCGRDNDSEFNSYYCKECAKKILNQKKINYDKAKRNGMCVRCGDDTDGRHIYCTKCRIQDSIDEKLSRQNYISQGVCPKCKKNSILGDEKSCPECRAKLTNKTLERREKQGKEEYNKQHAEWSRNSYTKCKEQGICTRCRKRKAEDNYTTCSICRVKMNTKRIERELQKGKTPRKERYLQGLCYFCDNPIEEGYKVCKVHHLKNIESANSEAAQIARIRNNSCNWLFAKG